ncbi:MAG: Gfo/Idh/MocA family oxidoreductase, partial [Planctomycetota bacterium]|nr:Gfo/Idh/MocA family oxidoreductase [Planctomycetota bacterium]
MNSQLRWGILGTGNIAGQFAAGVKSSRRSVITAAGSRRLDTVRKFATQHEIPRVYGSYDELLADPEVDAVYNALPNSLHHEWTIKALRAGKH